MLVSKISPLKEAWDVTPTTVYIRVKFDAVHLRGAGPHAVCRRRAKGVKLKYAVDLRDASAGAFLPIHARIPALRISIKPTGQAGSGKSWELRFLNDAHSTFWTCSAWVDEAAMRAFMMAPPHRTAMVKLLDWCDEASLVHWTQESAQLPDWHEAHRRLVAEGRRSKVTAPFAGARGVPDSAAQEFRRRTCGVKPAATEPYWPAAVVDGGAGAGLPASRWSQLRMALKARK